MLALLAEVTKKKLKGELQQTFDRI